MQLLRMVKLGSVFFFSRSESHFSEPKLWGLGILRTFIQAYVIATFAKEENAIKTFNQDFSCSLLHRISQQLHGETKFMHLCSEPRKSCAFQMSPQIAVLWKLCVQKKKKVSYVRMYRAELEMNLKVGNPAENTLVAPLLFEPKWSSLGIFWLFTLAVWRLGTSICFAVFCIKSSFLSEAAWEYVVQARVFWFCSKVFLYVNGIVLWLACLIMHLFFAGTYLLCLHVWFIKRALLICMCTLLGALHTHPQICIFY